MGVWEQMNQHQLSSDSAGFKVGECGLASSATFVTTDLFFTLLLHRPIFINTMSTNLASTTITNKLQSASREANMLTPERTHKVYPPESSTCNPQLTCSDACKPIDPYPVRQKDFFFHTPYLPFAKISCSNTAAYTCPCAPQYLDEIYPEEEQIRDQALDRMDDQANLWLPNMVFVNRCWASTIIHAQEEGNEFLRLYPHIE
ncbi:hypothetical protein BJ322DRAFT_1018009 [Thelephora terrestris]|uniref:Uncharacterized protein n=1 Tax=Thelephora terrestris TaxID=56493 RepID=A0A9P6HNJ1_9AGAM|nr:hypothetical protein BJ322DRAFT_1018009 [Thelephora terrestris]